MAEGESDVMTVEEGAAFLRVGRNALYDAIGRGEVPHAHRQNDPFISSGACEMVGAIVRSRMFERTLMPAYKDKRDGR